MHLTAWFYDPTADLNGWVNKIIAKFDGPFCHVELQFPDSTACTVYLGSDVVMKQRTFNSACYSSVVIPCTMQQCIAARGVAERLHDARVSCSALDMTSCLFNIEMCPSRTFCSKLVGQILNESRIIDLDFKTISPSALYRSLCAHVPTGPTRPVRQARLPGLHSTPSTALDFR